MINIKTVEWRNFKSYGDYVTKIDLSSSTGVSLIVGERDDDPLRRCATGKTSIIEAIVWCLCGSTTRVDRPGDSVINWVSGKDCFVKITTYDGWEIIRTRNLSGQDELIVSENGNDRTQSTSMPAQDFLYSTFKFDKQSILSSVVFGQFTGGFLESSEPKRRKILEKMMRVGNLNNLAATAKGKADIINNELSLLQADVTRLNTSITQIESQIMSSHASRASFEANREIKINNLKTQASKDKAVSDKLVSDLNARVSSILLEVLEHERALSEIGDISSAWLNYNIILSDYNSYVSRHDNFLQQKQQVELNIHSINQAIINAESRIAKLGNPCDVNALSESWAKYDQAISSIASVKQLIIKLQLNNDHLSEAIEKLSNNIAGVGSMSGNCPKCFNKIDKNHIEHVKDDFLREMDGCKAAISANNDKIMKAESALVKLRAVQKPALSVEQATKMNSLRDDAVSDLAVCGKNIDILNINLVDIDANINDCVRSIERLKSTIELQKPKFSIEYVDNLRQNIDNKNSNIASLQKQISSQKDTMSKMVKRLLDDINAVKSELNPYTQIIDNFTANVNSLRMSLDDCETKISEKKVLVKHYDYIRDSYANKKKIKSFWIGKLIPEFNRRIKYYLDYFEVDRQVSFDSTLAVSMSHGGYLDHSGGECKAIDLSIMLSMNDLHSSIFGRQANILILDEVDGRLDPFYIEKLASLVNDDIIKREDAPNNVLIISHKNEMRDRFPNKIRVKNKNGYSYIINE